MTTLSASKSGASLPIRATRLSAQIRPNKIDNNFILTVQAYIKVIKQRFIFDINNRIIGRNVKNLVSGNTQKIV